MSKKSIPIIERKWYYPCVAVIFIAIYFYAAYNTLKKSIYLNTYSKFTVGNIIKLSKNIRMSEHTLTYVLIENGIKKTENLNLAFPTIEKYKINYNGGRYLVIYDSTITYGSILLYKCGEVDSSLITPDSGWSKPPKPFSKECFTTYDSSVWYNAIFLKTIEILNIEVKPQ